MERSTRVDRLPNLGPVSARWLATANINTLATLERLGALESFLRVRTSGCKPNLNLLFALEGAIEGCRWNRLPPGQREALLLSLDAHDDLSTGQ